jgi:hypothetical protein
MSETSSEPGIQDHIKVGYGRYERYGRSEERTDAVISCLDKKN